MESKITLGHGSGGILTERLIKNLFIKEFGNAELNKLNDSALIKEKFNRLVFTTDSFVVSPLFFPGGDIGKLAIYGTVNDLSVMKAKPLYISLAFIIEEGLQFSKLKKIVQSIKKAAKESNVKIVTGDTKVVEKGKADGIFITSSGIGEVIIETNYKPKKGDLILLSGSIADHALAIISARDDFKIKTNIKSDCCSLYKPISSMIKVTSDIPFIRDATRGGIAMVLNELAEKFNIDIEIDEIKIPIKKQVSSFCDLLGFDPLTLANEGKFIAVIPANKAQNILNVLKNNSISKHAVAIGKIKGRGRGVVSIKTRIGGERIISKPHGEILPRIC